VFNDCSACPKLPTTCNAQPIALMTVTILPSKVESWIGDPPVRHRK
jgi:hypothetical protein